MKYIDIKNLVENTVILSGDKKDSVLLLPSIGGGLYLPEIITCRERYMTFFAEVHEEHSLAMNLLIFSKDDPDGQPIFNMRFGLMPKIRAFICIDLNLLDAHILFPGHNEGQLKTVCHGRRVEKSEIGKVVFSNYPCYQDVKLRLSNIVLTDDAPIEYPLPDVKVVDEMGQYKLKNWRGKMKDLGEMKKALKINYNGINGNYPYANWSKYGGWADKKLTEGSGYFSKAKKDERWWLVDPLGYAFFSIGPDCVVARADCRVDGLEKMLDWLPEGNDRVYKSMFNYEYKRRQEDVRRKPVMFSYEQANLYRAFGEKWYEIWKEYIIGILKSNGMNTLGNWSDENLFGESEMPYVATLPKFPTTEKLIFRDFPDVFSKEYEINAYKAAEYLEKYKNDPYMIGYFLGNEPSWAFVDNLIIADEVLHNEYISECKKALVSFLKEKYNTVEKLNDSWNSDFKSFEELHKKQDNISKRTISSREDMIAFSRIMLERYISIPSIACRRADPNHMNLGIRWAWISDELVVTGWKHFDVFSINCYSMDPTEDLDNVVSLGVDLPIVIGEFHFGALDAGLTATGLEAVRTQKDRGIAFRHYVENAAYHTHAVGCHYFQCYDQFVLGRFDGENYNIGLLDICSMPYKEMMASINECSENIYKIANGEKLPSLEKADSIPMIAY